MKNFKVVQVRSWTSKKLREKVEQALNDMTTAGWNIFSIEFSFTEWYTPTAYITFNK